MPPPTPSTAPARLLFGGRPGGGGPNCSGVSSLLAFEGLNNSARAHTTTEEEQLAKHHYSLSQKRTPPRNPKKNCHLHPDFWSLGPPYSSKDHNTHCRKCRPRTFPYIRFSVVNRDFTIIEKTFKPLYVMLSAVLSVVVFCVFSKFFLLVRFHVFRARRTTQEHPKRSQEHSESIRGSPKSVQEGSRAPQQHPFQTKL